MSYPIAIVVAALAGFLALSYEIVWIRIYGFLTGGTAATFGLVLGAFLVGTAGGSLASRGACRERTTGDRSLLGLVALLLGAASVLGFSLVPIVAHAVTRFGFPWTLIGVTLVAGLLGAILPLLSHFGIAPDQRTGTRIAVLYLANIVGSTAGPLLTGFILLDRLTVAQLSPVLAGLGLVSALLVAVAAGVRGWRLVGIGAVIVIGTAAVAVSSPRLHDGMWARLLYKREYAPTRQLSTVIENRSGVIAVDGGTVFGGGVYDGQFNTGLLDDRNLVGRAYALGAVHPAPRNVLFMGLGSGSWAQVIANHPALESLTVLEINPGYVELVAQSPDTRSLLDNPRVTVVIDDARRWLRANPERRFDAIVANISYYWRAQATLLLSQEFLALVQSHLAPQGVYYFNTTGSTHAQKTACEVFPFGFRVYAFMAVASEPIDLDRERLGRVIAAYRIDGAPVVDLSRADHRVLLEHATELGEGERLRAGRPWLESCEELLARSREHWTVTDDDTFLEWTQPWWWTFQPFRVE